MSKTRDVPLVSVIITTYKRPTLLVEAIDRVLAQTFKDYEVIAVEDGPHHAEDVVRRYQGRIQYVWRPNGGLAIARNKGASPAQGKWRSFLYDDDLWLPDKLERQLSLAKAVPEYGLIHPNDCILCNGPFELRSERYAKSIPSGWVNEALCFGNHINGSSTPIRT